MTRPPTKPAKTAADYMVIAISPALIMLLVGSLTFFLIEVFFRGEAIGSVRWVMFWFVLSVVLITRIGIEESDARAAAYGIALAVVTWIYLMTIYPGFIFGLILLAIVWWCAHKLTWDCTLVDDDEDASGGGLLETAGDPQTITRVETPLKPGERPIKKKTRKPHAPGLWVIYFSLAALPLFGIGQTLLPGEATAKRHVGFMFLFVYVAAALGLLLTTSFLGLRRYLRQRWRPMPPAIARGWLRFGTGVALFVLLGALLLPRPGVTTAWHALGYQIEHRLRQASDLAMRFNPHGKGEGRAGNQTQETAPQKNSTGSEQQQQQQGSSPSQNPGQNGSTQRIDTVSSKPVPRPGAILQQLFKILFYAVLVILALWYLYHRWEMFVQMARSFIAAVAKFFRDLFGFTFARRTSAPKAETAPARHQVFASYQNPFLTGKDANWSHEELVLYSYEALRVWAEERGLKPRPEQTAREFCDDLSRQFPELTSDLRGLSFLYGHAAYGTTAPARYDLEPVKGVWRFLGAG